MKYCRIIKIITRTRHNKINTEKRGISYYLTKLAMHGFSTKDYVLRIESQRAQRLLLF